MTEPTIDDEEVRAMLALDAVGALTADERAELVRALRGRPDLQAELEELRAAAMLLTDGVHEEPPPSLRSGVLAAVAATPQEPAAPVAPVAPVVPLAGRRRRTRWLAVGAAAAAAVVALAVGVVVTRDDGAGDQVAAVLDDAAARTIAMEGELAGLSIVYSATEDAAVLTGRGLPVPPDERVYELWAVRGSDPPQPVDTFRPDDDGDVELLLAGIDPDSATWAITEEPAGGSDAPTTPIIAITVVAALLSKNEGSGSSRAFRDAACVTAQAGLARPTPRSGVFGASEAIRSVGRRRGGCPVRRGAARRPRWRRGGGWRCRRPSRPPARRSRVPRRPSCRRRA